MEEHPKVSFSGFVFLNGFFVMAEFAMVKLRYTRVQMLKNTAGWRGTILAKIHTNLDAHLSACQLGVAARFRNDTGSLSSGITGSN